MLNRIFFNFSLKMLAMSAIAAVGLCATAMAADAVDSAIKPYEKVSDLSGNLNSVGSDTLNNLMTYWAEAFMKLYPNVKIQVKGEGSATAPPALTEGTAQLGPMSRAMKDTELDAFEKKHGFKPTKVTVALDCLAVFVHKDNPVKGLTMQQVDCIFSQTRKSGFKDIGTWGEAGLTGSWEKLPISLYGRNSVSGTYAFFKEHALLKGDFKDTVKEQPGSAGGHQRRGERQGRDRLLGHRLQNRRRPRPAAGQERRFAAGRADFRERPGGQVSPGPRFVHLCGEEAQRTAAAERQGVPQVRAFQGRPGDRRERRFRSAAREADRSATQSGWRVNACTAKRPVACPRLRGHVEYAYKIEPCPRSTKLSSAESNDAIKSPAG